MTTVIAFEQRLLVSLKAWMAKKYSVSGSSPLIVVCVSPTAWLFPFEQAPISGSSELDSSEPASSDLDVSGERFP